MTARHWISYAALAVMALLVFLAIRGAGPGMDHNMTGMTGMASEQTPAPSMAASSGAKTGDSGAMAGHDHSAHGVAGHTDADASAEGHMHGMIDVSADEQRPDLEISLQRDAASGWNLHITTTNFRFAPYNANGKHVVGEGHAHIYINGEKIARVYGPWYHMKALPKGTHNIEVTLNANNHDEYALGDARISRKVTVVER